MWRRQIEARLPHAARSRALRHFLLSRAALFAGLGRVEPFNMPAGPCVIASIHAGCWELAARLLAPIDILVSPPDSFWSRWAHLRRERLGLHSSTLREILRSSRSAAFMIDRAVEGEPATLLGKPILLSRLPWVVARWRGAPVIPAFATLRTVEFGAPVDSPASAAKWFDARLHAAPHNWWPAGEFYSPNDALSPSMMN